MKTGLCYTLALSILLQSIAAIAATPPSNESTMKGFFEQLAPQPQSQFTQPPPVQEAEPTQAFQLKMPPLQTANQQLVVVPNSNRTVPAMNPFTLAEGVLSQQLLNDLVTTPMVRYLEDVARVITVPGEAKNFKVVITSSLLPSIQLVDGYKIEISVGLIGGVKNEDELAAQMASVLAKANYEDLERVKADPLVRDILSAIRGFETLSKEARDYILVDLSVIDRLIRAGYSPWAHLDFIKRVGHWHRKGRGDRGVYQWILRRFNKKSWENMAHMPSDEIRSSVLKAYIGRTQERKDIAQILKPRHALPKDVQVSHRVMAVYTQAFRNAWFQRGALVTAGTLAIHNDVGHFAAEVVQAVQAFGDKMAAIGGAALHAIGSALSVVFSPVRWAWDLVADAGLWVGGELWSFAKVLGHYGLEGITAAWHGAEYVFGWIGEAGLAVWDNVLAPIGHGIGWLVNHLIPFDLVGDIEMLVHWFVGLLPSEHTVLISLESVASVGVTGFLAHLLNTHFIHTDGARGLLKDMKHTRLALPSPDQLNDQLSDNQIVDAWEKTTSILSSVQYALDHFPRMYSFRQLNGLTKTRNEMLSLFSDLIDIIVARLDREERSPEVMAFWTKIAKVTERIPGFVFEIPPIETQLTALRAAAQRFEMRSPLTVWESQTYAHFPGEYPFETRLRLLEITTTAMPDDLGEMIDLIDALWSYDLRTTALSLYGGRDHEFSRYVVSAANKDPQRIDKLRRLRTFYAEGQSIDDPGRFSQWQRSFRVMLNEIQLFESDLQTRLSQVSMRHKEPIFFDRWVEASDHRALRKMLGKHAGSLQELVAYATNEIVPAGGEMKLLTGDFEAVIQARPELIRTFDDVKTLLQTDYFWPRSYSWKEPKKGSLDAIFTKTLNQLIQQFPNVWSYEPASTARYHRLILLRMQELRIFPVSIPEQIELWSLLTTRGVSGDSDRFFYSIYQKADPEQQAYLERVGLLEGRVWEQDIKALIAERKVWSSQDFERLTASRDPEVRRRHLENILSLIRSYMPEGGWPYAQLLEKLSIAILSTEAESVRIHRAKTSTMKTEGDDGEQMSTASAQNTARVSLGTLAEIMDKILVWSRSDQWDFILFLRGDIHPTAKIRSAFQLLGPERVKRMYDVLPIGSRATLFESFLSSDRGLIPTVGKMGYTRTIIDHLISGSAESTATVSKNILESFMYALNEVGNTHLQSYILAYLLSIPSDEQKNAAEVLRQVLEVFGATGVKIGQFLAASQLLSDEESAILSNLQDRARVPERETIYQDLREILEVDKVPFLLGRLLGAASIKYASAATRDNSSDPVVLKVFRLEALAHTRLEFLILENMVEYLVSKYGKKYAVLRSIIKASKNAVQRELSAKDEVVKTEVFRTRMYNDTSPEGIRFTAPHEILYNERLIISQLMEGVSFDDLPASLKGVAATVILRKHRDLLWTDAYVSPTTGERVFEFDPDRHGANFRFQLMNPETGEFAAIDAGQLHIEIPVKWRDQLVSLFAISNIVAEFGCNEWAATKIAEVLGLTAAQTTLLQESLKTYYPDAKLKDKEVAAYFSLLAALDDAGIAMHGFFYDFVKGIVILNKYQPFVAADASTPASVLRERATAAGLSMEQEVRSTITTHEKVGYKIDQLTTGWNRIFPFRGSFTKKRHRRTTDATDQVQFDGADGMGMTDLTVLDAKAIGHDGPGEDCADALRPPAANE
jgi:predicted unusual protein kinase regulating ubiquinone biosynthesis (AarF/ABC1/UbiB family)